MIQLLKLFVTYTGPIKVRVLALLVAPAHHQQFQQLTDLAILQESLMDQIVYVVLAELDMFNVQHHIRLYTVIIQIALQQHQVGFMILVDMLLHIQ